MGTYSIEQVQAAIKQAHADGNIGAVNSLVDYYNELKAEERQEFVAHEPTKVADIVPQVTETIAGGLEASQRGYEQLSGMAAKDKVKAEEMPALATAQVVAPAVGGVFEAGIKTAGQVLSLATPDVIEKHVVEGVKGLTYDVMQNPTIRQGIEAAKEGMASWTEWKSENPEDGMRIESLIDVALLGIPATKVPPVTPKIDNLSRRAREAGHRQTIRERHAVVGDMLEPLVLEAGEGTTVTKGPLKRKTYIPSDKETETIQVVSLVPKLKPSGNFTDSRNAVYNEINATGERLVTRINNKGNPKINTQVLIDNLYATAEETVETAGYRLAGGTHTFAQDLVAETERLIKASDGTANGILQVRKDLDRFIKTHQPKQITAEYVNGKAAALGIVRNLLNDTVASAVPDVNVKGLLRKQHLMYGAWDTLQDKARQEAVTSIGRLWQNIHRTSGVSIPTTPLALGATASAGTAALSTGWMAWLTGGIAGAGGAYVGYKAVTSPEAKKALGALLGATNKAIKASKSKEMVEQLKADRLVLISMLQSPQDEDGEQE